MIEITTELRDATDNFWIPNLPISKKKERRHIKIETPENWEILYSNILEMRKDKTAPVDSMGCEKVQEMSTDPKVQRYHCLVSLMLSSQTKVCILCMYNIFICLFYLGFDLCNFILTHGHPRKGFYNIYNNFWLPIFDVTFFLKWFPLHHTTDYCVIGKMCLWGPP